jgi:hypothetical protein
MKFFIIQTISNQYLGKVQRATQEEAYSHAIEYGYVQVPADEIEVVEVTEQEYNEA